MDWINDSYLYESKGHHLVLFPETDSLSAHDIATNVIGLVGDLSREIVISPINPSCGSGWGDYCLSTFNFEESSIDYSSYDPSGPCGIFAEILQASVGLEFDGYCTCTNWRLLLPPVIECVILNLAPYSLLFYHEEGDFFFYFGNDKTIILYYQSRTKILSDILDRLDTSQYYVGYSSELDSSEQD